MTINILGTDYEITICSENDDKHLHDCDGYTDWTTKKIVVEKEIVGTLGDMECYVKKVLRHEIVHAFALESGLHECSGNTDAWACNEVMVDWFARQGPKIYAAWQEAGALQARRELWQAEKSQLISGVSLIYRGATLKPRCGLLRHL